MENEIDVEVTPKPEKNSKATYFKVNRGSISVGEGKTIVEGRMYASSDFSPFQLKHIIPRFEMTIFKPIDRYLNDIGMIVDRGNAPIIGYENSLPVFGVPCEPMNLLEQVTKKEYETFMASTSGSKVNRLSKLTPWRRSSVI